MRWLPGIITLVVIGAGILVIGVAVSSRGWYLVGVVFAALGLGFLAVIILALLTGSRWLRWTIAGALALILVATGVLSPQLAIGRPDSRPLWQTTSSDPWVRLVGGRLYLHSDYTDQVLEPDSGRILVSVPAESQGLIVGSDGSFVQLGEGTVVYRDPDGGQRWKLHLDASVTVLAIADGWVVMRGCSKEHDVVCGIDPKGRIGWREERAADVRWLGENGWQRAYDSSAEASLMGLDVEVAARVAVRVSHRRSVQLFSASHQLIGRLNGIPLAVGGDLVVSVDDAGAQCHFFGSRGTEEVFRSPAFDCTAMGLNGSYLMLARRMYFQGRGHPAGSWQLDLRNGKLRRTGPVDVSGMRSRSAQIYAGDDVLARQTGKTITGLDPDTGKRLWSYTAAGDNLPDVSVANGAVVLLSWLPDRAAVLSGIDPKDNPELITVLDGRTGRVTGRWVIASGHFPDGIWGDYGIGAGRALLMMDSGDVYAIGAHS